MRHSPVSVIAVVVSAAIAAIACSSSATGSGKPAPESSTTGSNPEPSPFDTEQMAAPNCVLRCQAKIGVCGGNGNDYSVESACADLCATMTEARLECIESTRCELLSSVDDARYVCP